MIFCMVACGDNTPAKKERKRATAGQDTTTSSKSEENQVVLDTGMLTALDKTYAKSNKANVVYDANVFLNLVTNSSRAVKVAVVGDEITFGKNTTDVANTYPSKLQKMLDERYGKGKFEVTNYATEVESFVAEFDRSNAGSNRYCYTDEYRKLRKDKPDIVIMMLGTNDIAYINDGESCDEYKKAYADLIKDIKKLKSNPLVFVCTPIVRYTAYSSYLANDALRNATVAAANEAKAYVIDTYNITKEYFSSALYETDGKRPDNAGHTKLAKTIMDGITEGCVEYKEGDLKDTSNYVVYVSSAGKYDSVGATPENPTSSFARAVELCQGGGTIVVCGSVTPTEGALGTTLPAVLPENYNKITVTSTWNGVDYREDPKVNARIYLSGSIYLNGDFEFTNVTFDNVASATKIVCKYNDVTFGDGFSTVNTQGGYSVLIVGNDVVSKWQTSDVLSCKEDCNIVAKAGTFTYLRGGDYRAYSTEESKYAYGTIKSGVTLNITVDGATFNRGDSAGNYGVASSTLTSAIGQNGMEKGSVVNFNVNSGSITGSIAAVPRMNPYPASGTPAVAGTINMNLKGGRFGGKAVEFMQTFEPIKDANGEITVDYRKPSVTATFNLSIEANTFTSSANKLLKGDGCGNANLVLGANFPESLFTITGFKR